ncbi:unnamed protein product [Durusdinium trenchii]|uniref:PH domain-containing protein n=1 Tax=Durusdinium trenchii TaxID=1381693 RepID=A0ABP0IFW4_9DINO
MGLPCWVMAQESNFFGLTSRWGGPHFAVLQHGTFQVYKVSQRVELEVDVGDAMRVGTVADLSREASNGLVLRICFRSPAAQGHVDDLNDRGVAEPNLKERECWSKHLAALGNAASARTSDESAQSALTDSSSAAQNVEESVLRNERSADQGSSESLLDAATESIRSNAKEGIVLCSSVYHRCEELHAGAIKGRSSELDFMERRPWARRLLRLSNEGKLEVVHVTMIACVPLCNKAVQILLEEQTSCTLSMAGLALLDKQTTQNGKRAENRDSEKHDDSNEKCAGASRANSVTAAAGPPARASSPPRTENTSATAATAANCKPGSPSKSSFGTSAGEASYKCFPFTISGEKIPDVPLFPYERSSTFGWTSLLWRKVALPGAVTLAAASPQARESCVASLQTYLNVVRADPEAQRNRRTSARILAKGWMMYRCGGSSRFFSGSWKKRFCVLLASNELVFYRNDTASSRQSVAYLHKVSADHCTTKTRQGDKQSDADRSIIEIKTRRRVHELYPCDDEDYAVVVEQWIMMLKRLTRSNELQDSSRASDMSYASFASALSNESSRHASSVASGDPEPLSMAGALQELQQQPLSQQPSEPHPPPSTLQRPRLDDNKLRSSSSFSNLSYGDEEEHSSSESTMAVTEEVDEWNAALPKPPPLPDAVSQGPRESVDTIESEEGACGPTPALRLDVSPTHSAGMGLYSPRGPFAHAGGAVGAAASARTRRHHRASFGRLKAFNSSESWQVRGTSRASSFDHAILEDELGESAADLGLGHARSQSGGGLDELLGPLDSTFDVQDPVKVVERTRWQRISGNLPIDCLSLSPYSALILAEQLTSAAELHKTESGKVKS